MLPLPVLCVPVFLALLLTGANSEQVNSTLAKSDSKIPGEAEGKPNGISKRAQPLTNDVPILEDPKAKRHPKFGFNIPLPAIPGLTPSTMTTLRPPGSPGDLTGGSGTGGSQYYNQDGNLDGSAGGLGLASTAFLVKSGILGGLTALKAAVIPPLFIGSIIVFLIAGAIFFTCSVINCGSIANIGGGSNSGIGGAIGPGGLPSFSNLFNRNGYDYYEQQVQPVYQALDDGYKKFE